MDRGRVWYGMRVHVILRLRLIWVSLGWKYYGRDSGLID